MSEELNPNQEAAGSSGLTNNNEGTTNNNNGSSEAAPPAAANNNNEAPNPTPARGIVSSENSVASNSTASTKAAALVAANKETTASANEGKDAVTTKTEEASKSLTSTSNETKTTNGNSSTSGNSNSNANSDHMLQMAAPPHYPVAEFLFQLTKMLTDDNKEFIEWKHSSILVHDPPGLEKQILPKYFRHSNYSSFQRQMNYFGFRKIAGKGKMAACSYVNENATEDISSLLYIKRKKTGVSSSAAKLLAQANKLSRVQGVGGLDPTTAMGLMANPMMMMNAAGGMNPMMMGMASGGGMMAGLNAQQQLALMQQQQQNANLMGLNGVSLQGMNGLQQGMNLQGIGAMGGAAGINALPNMMLASQAGQGGAGNPLNDARLREQQQILAQLQQAHASASSGLNSSNNNLSNSTNQALKNNFGLNGLQGSAHILTNDQGNLYTGGNAQFMANAAAGNNAQALLQMQQAAAMSGLGSFPQAANGAAAPGDNKGLDAANFRSFLNQQISMFAGGNPPAAAAAKGDAANMMTQGKTNVAAPGTVDMSNLPQGLPGNLPQGLSYEQFFQLNGVANGASAAATAAAGAEAQQQLLSRSGNA